MRGTRVVHFSLYAIHVAEALTKNENQTAVRNEGEFTIGDQTGYHQEADRCDDKQYGS